MSGNGANKQQQMTMMMGMVCVCCVCALAIGAGAFLMMGNKKKEEDDPPAAPAAPTTDTSNDTPTGGGDLAGVRTIKYGNTTLVVPPKAKCNPKSPQSYKVYLNNGSENNQHQWKFIDVPNRPGEYYVRSEAKMFGQGCPLYLTSPQNCEAGNDVGIDKAKYAERQYWKAVSTGNGYQLVSVHCEKGRGNKYLVSRGTVGAGKSASSNTMRMTSREGAIYNIDAVSSD